jgi:alpha 1,2-mannosyltransferase
MTYFDYLDKAGGFFYERWGDAPVHSIAVAMFLKPEEVHFFNDIGYRHNPFQHCPTGGPFIGKCYCDPKDNFDYEGYSCTARWLTLYKP